VDNRCPLAVLTNLASGANRQGRHKRYRLQEIVGERGLVLETETVEEIDGAVERILSCGARLVCLNGGDGTVQRTLTHLINILGEESPDLPLIFPLRGGTLNVLADNLGLKGRPDQLARLAVRTLQASDDHRMLPWASIPTLRLTRESAGGIEREYGFFFGNGALYRFDQVYYRETRGGPLAAAGLFLKCAAAGALKKTRYAAVFGTSPMRVRIDGFNMPAERFTIVLAMAFKKVVLTFDPFLEGEGGEFYTLATSLPFGRMVTRLPRLLWVRGDRPPYPPEVYWNRKSSEVVIEAREGYTLDGELIEPQDPYRLTITRGPDVRVLRVS